jgi:hypothetical protein
MKVPILDKYFSTENNKQFIPKTFVWKARSFAGSVIFQRQKN